MLEQLYTSIPHSFRNISIKSNDHKLIEHFYYQLSPYVFWGNDSCFERTYEFIEIIKGEHGFTINCNEKKVIADTEKAIIHYLNRKILWSILIENPYVAFHCAALSNTSSNLLFVGPSGVGKSTLSAFLSKSGFTYYTDDKLIINCLDGTIVPFTKPIYLREGGRIVLEKEYKITFPKKSMEFGGEKRYLLEWQSADLPEQKRIRVIFVNFSRTENATLKYLSKQDACIRLTNNLIFAYPLDQKIKLILQLMQDTECFTLNYYDLNDALRLIKDL